MAMPVSPYIAALRDRVGPDVLLLVPSVSVVPTDAMGRVLLIRHAHTGQWGTIGGSIEIDESPADAARREAQEEAGVNVRLGSIVAALGGPQFRVRYPNGDEAAYVAVVYEAEVVGGDARPDGEEATELRWVSPHELPALDLAENARATFSALGLI